MTCGTSATAMTTISTAPGRTTSWRKTPGGFRPARYCAWPRGEGRNAAHLAQLGHAVTAVDASSAGIAKTERLCAERGVAIECVHADLADFDLGEARWSGIVSIFAHLPPPLRQRVHAAIPAALRPGGILLLEAYTPRQLQHGTGGPPVAELMMSEAVLRNELAGLEILHLQELEREVIEGRGHTGTGAVVQLIARRPD